MPYTSIVHEAFNGLATTLVTRGVRKYNSLIIIGTQERNLGMTQTSVNMATFSRLSHIDMAVDGERFAYEEEKHLQEALQDLDGMLMFLVENVPFDAREIAERYKHFAATNTHVISRSLQIAAIDSYFASILWPLLGMPLSPNQSRSPIDSYFGNDYMEYLNMHCGRSDAVERFCADLKNIVLRRGDVPDSSFKRKVTVDLKHFGPTECFAVYTKELLPYMSKLTKLTYTKEQLHGVVKSVSTYGEVSKNVAYTLKGSSIVRRSLVIRRVFIE